MTFLLSRPQRRKMVMKTGARKFGPSGGQTISVSGLGMFCLTFLQFQNSPTPIPSSALKLRYMLPIQTPSQPLAMPLTTSTSGTPLSSPSAAAQKFQFGKADREPPILFDAKVVAKKDGGWEDMLERVLYRWMEKVLEERRVHH